MRYHVQQAEHKCMKYQSWFFLTLFLLGWTILMPTYNSGKDAEKFIEQAQEIENSSDVL